MPAARTRHQAEPTPPRRSMRARRPTTYLHDMVSTDPMAQMTPETASVSSHQAGTSARASKGGAENQYSSGEDSDFEGYSKKARSKNTRKPTSDDEDGASKYLDVGPRGWTELIRSGATSISTCRPTPRAEDPTSM